jgi:hypothetical protein
MYYSQEKLEKLSIRKHIRIDPNSEQNAYIWAIFRADRYGVTLNSFSSIIRDILSNIDNPNIMNDWLQELGANGITTKCVV